MNKEVHDRVLAALKKRLAQHGYFRVTQQLAASSRLAALPLGPLELAGLVSELENWLGISLDDTQIDALDTVEDLIAAIDRQFMPIRFVVA